MEVASVSVCQAMRVSICLLAVVTTSKGQACQRRVRTRVPVNEEAPALVCTQGMPPTKHGCMACSMQQGYISEDGAPCSKL